MTEREIEKIRLNESNPSHLEQSNEFSNFHVQSQSISNNKKIKHRQSGRKWVLFVLLIFACSAFIYLITMSLKQNKCSEPDTKMQQINRIKRQSQLSLLNMEKDFYEQQKQIKAKLVQINFKLNQFQLLQHQEKQQLKNAMLKVEQKLTQLKTLLNQTQYKVKQQKIQSSNTQFIAKIQESKSEKQPKIQLSKIQVSPLTRSMTNPVSDQYKFKIPKIVWLYLDRPINKEDYFVQRCIQNVKWYTNQSGFQLRIVDHQGYDKWLQNKKSQQVSAIIKQLEKLRNQSKQLNQNFQSIRETIIKLALVKQFGGISIKKKYILTQNLDWLENIKSNAVVNIGNSYAKPRFFGFISMKNCPNVKQQNKQVKIGVQKNIIKLPALKQQFFSSYPQGSYITDLFDQYVYILKNVKSRKQIFDKIKFPNTINSSISNFFTLASQIVLIKKQNQLDNHKQLVQGKYYKFAIDQYGLFAINSNFYPDKMEFLFIDKLHDNCFNFIAKIPQQEFQYTIGPMRYLTNSDPYGYFSQIILKIVEGSANYTIVQGSFVHRHLFMDKKYQFIQQNLEKRIINSSTKQWENLPKIIWLIWDIGFQTTIVTIKLSVMNLKKKAQASGFKVNLIQNSNIHLYLSNQEQLRINQTLANAKMQINTHTRSNLYRIALVSKYGGIYLDSSFFFLQDLSWITNIANQNPKQIFNRFGDVPKVMLQFHPFEGGMFNWTIDTKANTKVNWHLSYENNFIIAEKNSQFMREWYDMYHQFLKSDYPKMQAKMIECNTFSHKWSHKKFRYLTCMDSLKTVIGCKQMDIQKNPNKYKGIVNANDYYKLWAINGFTGIQKFRHYNEYGLSYERRWEKFILLTHYSKAITDEIIGPVFHTFKFYGGKIGRVNDLIINHWKDNFTNQVHPDSYFAKYMFRSEEMEFYQNKSLLQVRYK